MASLPSNWGDLLIAPRPLQNLDVGPMPNLLTSTWNKVEDWFSGKNVDTTGMSPQLTKTAQTGKSVQNLGLLTSVLAGVSSAIESFYAAKSAQYHAKSEASSLAFQSDMDAINASRAETTAQSIEEAGKSQVANYTMRAGQEKAGAVATMASRGIALGVGSAAEVAASMDIEKDLNVMAINSNSVRQAWAAREQATNFRNESLLDRASSVNSLRTANSISPGLAVTSSLLGSATQIAGQWDWDTWMRKRLASGLPAPQVGIG